VPQVVGRRCFLPERCSLGLIAAHLGCFRGDWVCISHGDGSSFPAAGEPRLPLMVHVAVVELKLVP
jgi:hypothetical protein